MSLTWDEHKAAGRELQYERDFLFQFSVTVMNTYGKDSEPSLAVCETLEALDRLRKSLALIVVAEDHRAAGHDQITYVYYPARLTEPNCVTVMRERELT